MLKFEEAALRERLSSLSQCTVVLFATCCAERLFASYEECVRHIGTGASALLRGALDELWNVILRTDDDLSTADTRVHDLLKRYDAILPDDESAWHILNAVASDAVCAVLYACQMAQTGRVEYASWAAVCEYDTGTYIAEELEGVDSNEPDAAERIDSFPCVQAHLQAQQEDLSAIEACRNCAHLSEKLIRELQERAIKVGKELVPYVRQLGSGV